jgi:hypothetical protein
MLNNNNNKSNFMKRDLSLQANIRSTFRVQEVLNTGSQLSPPVIIMSLINPVYVQLYAVYCFVKINVSSYLHLGIFSLFRSGFPTDMCLLLLFCNLPKQVVSDSTSQNTVWLLPKEYMQNIELTRRDSTFWWTQYSTAKCTSVAELCIESCMKRTQKSCYILINCYYKTCA